MGLEGYEVGIKGIGRESIVSIDYQRSCLGRPSELGIGYAVLLSGGLLYETM